MKPPAASTYFVSLSALLLAGCGQSTATSDDTATPLTLVQIKSDFAQEAMVSEPKLVDCTLSGGAKTRCIAITFGPAPVKQKIGPFCPRNIADGPDKSGVWLEGGKVYDADGAFISKLPEFYDDESFILFDEATGDIRVTDNKLSCEAAARPDVAEEYRNHCVECEVDYVEPGKTLTYVIPVQPFAAESIASRVSRSGVGISFNGARLDAQAPTDAILAAHTLAPFDDCGGHVNPNVGYHIHAATDCLIASGQTSDHGTRIGLAMDGYAIFSQFSADGKEADDLDQCRGHISEEAGYHYHANAPGSNAILPCHTGQTGCALNDQSSTCDASANERRGPPPQRVE